jgi:hypothetical protein
MYALTNPELTVLILDPTADVARLGSRYCTGGYIWQVLDAHRGELFTGPEYPKPPNTFDGQGAPDMFRTPLGADGTAVGQEVGCIGVGRVRRTCAREPFDVRYNREVIEFLKWSVDCSHTSIVMRTEHSFRDWSYLLERTVSLFGRTVQSRTAIESLGPAPLPIRWFAHPFFPITADNILCRFSFPIRLPENPGYFLNPDGFVGRKPSHPWSKGCYQALEFNKPDQPMLATQKHPLLGELTVATDFVPAFLPIWGNDRTTSFEPYFERTLSHATQASWSIEYRLCKEDTLRTAPCP